MNLPKISLDRVLDRKNPAIRAVLNLPEVKTAIDAAELRDLDARKLLEMERNAILKGKYAKQRTAATETLLKAQAKVDKLQADLKVAIEEWRIAYQQDTSITKTEALALMTVEQQLIESANIRAGDYWDCLDSLKNAVRVSQMCWVESSRDAIGRRVEKPASNNKEMRAALALLEEASKDMLETRFMAISNADLYARMLAWNAKLAPVLREFDLQPPRLNADGVDPAFISQIPLRKD